ncbi:TonB-dependent receptor domain-containing protein [Parvularcula oceani]|uniref:TonB-dependent receptor domain-containing protein n=1 Tax=Parvularcula oceani TaxID=1247963 RepID=UPI0004E23E50|nr:TonB-dependent receptor [Parvularcula oceani]
MQLQRRSRRALLLASAASVYALGGIAFAQDEGESPAAEAVQESVQNNDETSAAPIRQPSDEIVVTGSRLRRDTFTSASPIDVITAEQATLEGLIDTASIVQGSSVASGSVQLNNQFGGFVVEGGTGINSVSLRGLGAQRSLVLLNGRRPGPAGVRGQVGSFDLGVIPDSIIQRVEILKDGASSVYGSDAVAGVVNVITLTSVERPTITVQTNQPFSDGGASYSVDGAYGFNFDNGSIALAGQWELIEELDLGDRDYLSCPMDMYYDPETGRQIDRQNRSVLADDENFANCNSGTVYFNTAIVPDFGLAPEVAAQFLPYQGERFIPAPDGMTIGPISGYRPRTNGRYDDGDGEPAYYEDVINDYRALEEDAINRTERFSLYGVSDFDLDLLGGTKWVVEGLFTRRETQSDGTRQFFPLVGGATSSAVFGAYGYANDPSYDNPLVVAQPIMIYPSNSEVTLDYYSLSSDLSGEFGGTGYFSDWGWNLTGTYSRSEGEYTNFNQIFADQSGDARYDDDAPVFDYFSPEILSGYYPSNFYSTLGGDITGETTYEQWVASGYVSGDLFELPAGDVLLALGAEYRDFSIDDQPDEQAQAGNLWGFSSAQVTKGSDSVAEAYGEIEVPILRGMPGIEELTFNGSARAFDYDSTGSDAIWKAGVNWQVIPQVRVRGTIGTSYRAPALYELFLGNQTSFLSQIAIDPCIDYGESSDEDLVRNCSAIGIEPDYAGGASSATITSGGGEGVLVPETSEARTFGVILTPEILPLSLAVDYFEIEVNDQIDQLGAASILSGCYGGDNFPNAFCDLIVRGTDTDEFAIDTVNDSFVNINTQETRGIDATLRYEQDFDFGTILVESQATWTLEDTYQLFSAAEESGFETEDFNSTIGDPDVVSNGRAQLQRGDWTFTWFYDFVGHTSNEIFDPRETTYFGADAIRKNETEAVWYHDASVRWRGENNTITAGVTNLFDEEPPVVSADITSRRGNVPVFGSQYDLRGRTAFIRFTQDF